MTDRQNFERYGFTRALEEERFIYLSACVDPDKGSEMFQTLWTRTCASVGVEPPAGLKALRASSFKDRGFLCLSVRFPQPEHDGECYYACCIVGQVLDMEGVSFEKQREAVNRCDWHLFMFTKRGDGGSIFHYTGADNMTKVADSELIDEGAFAMMMFDSIARNSLLADKLKAKKKGLFSRWFGK